MKTMILLSLVVALAGAARAEESARQILDRRRHLDDTTRKWTDRHQKMTMHIQDRRGGERLREIELYERKDGDEQKAIVFFLSPSEVKGTGLLSFTHKDKPADQWLYLPELKRVRQITSRSRDESFVGTDLTYRDLDLLAAIGSWTEDDATTQLKGTEAIEGTPCYVIELTSKREDIGYRRMVLWIGKDDLVTRRFDFYAEGGDPKRRIVQSDVRPVGAIPVAHRMQVETPADGTRTIVEISNVQFDQGLGEDLFTQRYLERGGR